MEKTMRRFTLLSTFLFALATIAGASTTEVVTFNTLPQSQANGYYAGYVGATVDGSPLDAICDDFTDTTYVPSGPFEYNETDLGDLSTVLFSGGYDALGGQLNQLEAYQTAAVLLYQYNQVSSTASQQTTGEYQYAIWDLFNHSVGSFGNSDALLNGAEQTVDNGGIAAAYSGLRILTPQVLGSNQEFLAEIPEPTSLAFVGSGLIFLVGTIRRYSKH